MSNPPNPAIDELVVTAVQFGDEGIEISYFEKRDQGANVGVFKSMLRSTTGIEEDIADVLRVLHDIVDDGMLSLRNPPDRISGARERILHGNQDASQN